MLATIKIEAGKVYDKYRKRKLAAPHAKSEDAVLAEKDQLTSQIAFIEWRSVSLYEDFVDGKIDREQYVAAKNRYAAEFSTAQVRISELDAQLESFVESAKSADDEPLLQRVLSAEDLTDEILALVERITVFDNTRIEVSFAFGDANSI